MKKTVKLLIAYAVYVLAAVAIVIFIYSISGGSQDENTLAKPVMQDKVERKMDENSKYIILTFDDAWSSQYRAFELLKPLKGTLYICSSFIGEKDRLTMDNLKEMYNNGWDISNHTVHHINMLKTDMKKAYDEVYGCSSWIAGNGFTRDQAYLHFAYPEGGYNEEIIKMLAEQGILTARTTNAGNDTSKLLELGRTSLHGMSKENIRNKILSDEKLIILSLHRIVPDDVKELAEIDLPESYFMEVIDSIKESKREVITITEWYAMNKQ